MMVKELKRKTTKISRAQIAQCRAPRPHTCRCPTSCGSRASSGRASIHPSTRATARPAISTARWQIRRREISQGYKSRIRNHGLNDSILLVLRRHAAHALRPPALPALRPAPDCWRRFPRFAFGASGNYEAMLVTCIDPRFPQPTINYMKRRQDGRQIQPVHLRRRFDRRGRARVQNWAPAFWDNLAAIDRSCTTFRK